MLNLAKPKGTTMSDCGFAEANNTVDRKTLRILLLIITTMFVVGITAGLLGRSTALVADSFWICLLMLQFISCSLYVLVKRAAQKNRAVSLSGIFKSL
jgi:Co/Zn/Cd efflux system component